MKFILFLMMILSSVTNAQLSPGDLAQPHADLEGLENCTKCHEIGKQLVFDKCLDCHKILRGRIKEEKGLHAHNEYKNCTDCHHDHQGREFDMIWWKEGRDNFNHDLTGYALLGKHKNVKCRDCHKADYIQNKSGLREAGKNPDRTYLGLDQKCLSCHIDEHRGQTGKDCLKCHDMNGWKPVPKFDHSNTRYRLTGRHNEVKCEQCHKKITDNKYPNDVDFLRFKVEKFQVCTDCHKDIHKGKFGQDCEKCHNTSGWKNYTKNQFNHDKTRYPLKGRHRYVDCEKCHPKGVPLTPIAFNKCTDCHSDIHFGQFTDRIRKGTCEECHDVNGFKPAHFTLAAHNESRYKLEGAHLAVPCLLCHFQVDTGTRKERLQFTFSKTKCINCHDDVHKGEVDKYVKKDGCEYCHKVESWRLVKFDHNLTKFKLLDKHGSTDCIKCHKLVDTGTKKERFQFLNVSQTCIDCHEDIHLGQFLNQAGQVSCDKCHGFKDWFAEKFNHNRDSIYKIDGAHASVKCSGCHKKETKGNKEFVRYKPIGTTCSTCHKGSEILREENKI